MVSLLDISISSKWEGKRGGRPGRPTSKTRSSLNRKKRRDKIEVVFLNNPPELVQCNTYGKYSMFSNSFNEGLDYIKKIKGAKQAQKILDEYQHRSYNAGMPERHLIIDKS